MEKSSGQNGKTRWEQISYTRVWWLAVSAIAVALVLGLGALDLIRSIGRPLAVFVFGLTLAASLAPLISWLERWMPRLPATLLVYLILILVLGALIWGIIPSLVTQVEDLTARLPGLLERAREWINTWRGNFAGDTFANGLFSQLSRLSPALFRLPLSITSTLFVILLILFISFYVLLEADSMEGYLLSLFPREQRPRIQRVLGAMADSMGGYIRGVVINGIAVGFLTFAGLLVLGIDFAVAFGVMSGLLELLPVIGPIVAATIIVGLTLFQSPGKALAVLIFMIVMQQVENNVLVPNIMRSQTKISPLLSILALFAGAAVGGLTGALIAIPIAAALRVLVHQVAAPAIRRQTGAAREEGGA